MSEQTVSAYELSRKRKRMLCISLAVALVFTVTASAMTVDKFSDYNPPDTLMISWYDYFRDAQNSGPSSNNAVTAWPRWSAEYPYRTFLLGARSNSSAQQKHTAEIFIIWSKKPILDMFRFEYRSSRGTTGYLRALVNANTYTTTDDFRITYGNAGDMLPSTLDSGHLSFLATYTTTGHTIGSDLYLDFDFYYHCAHSVNHGLNAESLTINGLRNISVPYAYILKCNDHSGGGGSESGSASSGGGSSSGGSSSGGSGGSRPSWGNGEYGSGVDESDLIPVDDGGGYSSRPDMDVSVPNDWKKPVEDDYNGGLNSEYTPDYPPYVPSDGDTGNNGGDWDLPSFNVENDGVSGEASGYKNFEADGETGFVGLEPGASQGSGLDLKPNAEQGLIDFNNY